MSTESEPAADVAADNNTSSSRLSADIRKAIELGGEIQETVRSVTLKALSKGELDTESLRRVAGEVLNGAIEGASNRGTDAKESVSRAIAGLDEAFANAAEAATLAAREASGRMRDFTSGDLRRAMDNLKNMEGAFIDSLRDAAKAGRDVASITLRSFAEHAANSGTAVGKQVQSSMDLLGGELGRTAEAQIKGSIETGRTMAALLARAASGFLAGIAEMIEAKPVGKSSGSAPQGEPTGPSSSGGSPRNSSSTEG